MTRRNLTTTFIVVGAALLLYGGVALAREQQTREDHSVPAATQAAATFDDNGIDASGSPELQASDDHGKGLDDSPEASASPDDRGNGLDDSPEASASPDDNGNGLDDSPSASASPDDKTSQPSAGRTSSIEDGHGHGGGH